MSRERLSNNQIEERRQALDGWIVSQDWLSISRSFKFEGFIQAFGFMSECAIYAEKIDHHPEWSNVYKTVDVMLTTHSSKGLTELDFNLARFMDAAARRH